MKVCVSNLFQSHVAADNLIDLILRIQIQSLDRWRQWILILTEWWDVRPHHTDELDELKPYSNNHGVLEVIDGTDNLIVASEEGFDKTRFVRGGPGCP